MGSRRSRFQISIDVLTSISNGEHRPTRIMYGCNLSWNSTKDTLNHLVAKGYVDEVSETMKRKRYSITTKGRDVIEDYGGLQDIIQISVN